MYKYFRGDVITTRRFSCVECTQSFKDIRMGYLNGAQLRRGSWQLTCWEENKRTVGESGIEIVVEQFGFMHRVYDWSGVVKDSPNR